MIVVMVVIVVVLATLFAPFFGAMLFPVDHVLLVPDSLTMLVFAFTDVSRVVLP